MTLIGGVHVSFPTTFKIKTKQNNYYLKVKYLSSWFSYIQNTVLPSWCCCVIGECDPEGQEDVPSKKMSCITCKNTIRKIF